MCRTVSSRTDVRIGVVRTRADGPGRAHGPPHHFRHAPQGVRNVAGPSSQSCCDVRRRASPASPGALPRIRAQAIELPAAASYMTGLPALSAIRLQVPVTHTP